MTDHDSTPHHPSDADAAADGPSVGAEEPEGIAFASDETSEESAGSSPEDDTSIDSMSDTSADGPDDAEGTDWDLLAEADERTRGQLLQALSAASNERDEYLDDLRRKQAEFDNFRKRMMRDGAAQRITGHAEVAERLLDVLDDFDRTLENAGDVDPGFLKGVKLVNEKFVRVLQDFGLQRIDDQDSPFDPTRHEAVQQVPADEELEEPIVAQVLRPGYELGGRVLRPAMVAVKQ